MFCWCIREDVDGDEDDGHADDVIEGEVCADPEIGEDAGGNGFDAGNDAGFDGADFGDTSEEGSEGENGTNEDETREGQHTVEADGGLVVKGACDNRQTDTADEHGPGGDRQAAPFLNDADRDDVVGGKENRRGNAPK